MLFLNLYVVKRNTASEPSNQSGTCMGPVTIVLGLFVIWAAFVVFQFVMTRREATCLSWAVSAEIDAGEAYPPFERAICVAVICV